MYKIRFYRKLTIKHKADFDRLIKELFVWHESGRKHWEEADKFCSKRNEIGFVLSFDADELIGAVVILKRRLKNQLILGGIGGVCVKPRFRRQSVATKMLKIAMINLKKEKCDLVYLCTDVRKLKNLYAAVGFTPLNRPHTFLGKSGKRYTEHDAMIAPVNSPEKFKAVLNDNKPFDIGRGNW